MKNIRIVPLFAIIIFTALFIASCGSTEERLVGTWITESVVPSIDSTKATPSDLAKIENSINSQKTMKFILNEDHTMALSVDGSNWDAFWSYNSDDDMITFTFDQESRGGKVELGKYESGDIVYSSEVIHGTITSVYVKE